jgi:hypothetical protein
MKSEQNQPAEKPANKKPSMMDIIREKRRQARSDMMVRRHANLGNTSVRKRNS